MTSWSEIDAERAFSRAARARRRASLMRRVHRRCMECARLLIHDERTLGRSAAPARRRFHEIPLDAITGTLEPNRAAQFDRDFRPAATTRARWLRVWLADDRGTPLPPISVIRVGDAYAICDGHHRVSVAKARGALSIAAIVA